MHPDWPILARLAEEELNQLRHLFPRELQERFDSVAIFMEELPPDFLLEEGVAEDTMGLFEGPAFDEEAGAELPPRMTLFLLNIMEEAEGDEEAFRHEVRITLLHELGHYLGLDESDLADRELE